MEIAPVIHPELSFGLPVTPAVGRKRKGKAERHWIYFHDPVKKRFPIGRSILLEIETEKMLDRKRLMGDVVHLITTIEAGTRYQLLGYFHVMRTEVLPVVSYRRRPMLSIGSRMAIVYMKRVELNALEWFHDLEAKGRLKCGFRWVRDPVVLEGLLELTRTRKRGAVMGG